MTSFNNNSWINFNLFKTTSVACFCYYFTCNGLDLFNITKAIFWPTKITGAAHSSQSHLKQRINTGVNGSTPAPLTPLLTEQCHKTDIPPFNTKEPREDCFAIKGEALLHIPDYAIKYNTANKQLLPAPVSRSKSIILRGR